MSVEGGYSWAVVFPIFVLAVVISSIWIDNIYLQIIASIFASMFGLMEIQKYRWLS